MENDFKKIISRHNLSKYATKDEDAIYFKKLQEDIRPTFYHDIDKILYTLAFIRYGDKTQVFTHKGNDHLTKRIMHVLYVSKIARTIGRALGLNEDLIEAASLAHDLGHPPFGHVGEKYLNEISIKNGVGLFKHNIQSVRILMTIEGHGRGKNISLQVLDAIMCHNGEIVLSNYQPVKKDKKQFLKEYQAAYSNIDNARSLKPMTLEGCVVRISDLIAYLGRDIEDALRLQIISKDSIPKEIKSVLGQNNKEIINTIVLDIINNSYNKPYLKISPLVFQAISKLKKFNYENIYAKAYTALEKKKIKLILNTLFEKYLQDLQENNLNSNIIKSYLSNMDTKYLKSNSFSRIAIDYIAGMTDDYILKEYNNYLENIHNKKEVSNGI